MLQRGWRQRTLGFAFRHTHSRFAKEPHLKGLMQEMIKHTSDVFLCVCVCAPWCAHMHSVYVYTTPLIFVVQRIQYNSHTFGFWKNEFIKYISNWRKSIIRERRRGEGRRDMEGRKGRKTGINKQSVIKSSAQNSWQKWKRKAPLRQSARVPYRESPG